MYVKLLTQWDSFRDPKFIIIEVTVFEYFCAILQEFEKGISIVIASVYSAYNTGWKINLIKISLLHSNKEKS